MADAFPFFKLPIELRDVIYSAYFKPADRLIEGEYGGGEYRFDFSILRVSKQVCTEAQDVFRRENVFVRIETPWPQAAHHIAQEGMVPIVAAGSKGDLFRHHHALVQISAPLHEFVPTHTIVVLLDDLHLFCQVWYYSSLNYRTLNEHLRVNFVLQDPYYPADPKPIPLPLQKRLLLPFEKVKGLYEIEIQGYDDGVKEELERLMAIPYKSVQKCLEDSTALMEDGDSKLDEGDPTEALRLYNEAFCAIHILIAGRNRRVLADAWFHEGIPSGQYAGQTGPTIRIILRLKLVARTVKAYLKLEQWDEAAFWGMRSIKIMREAIDTEFEEFLAEFVGAADVGLIYLRTAIAFRKMEDNNSAELQDYRDMLHVDDIGNSALLFLLAEKYLKGKNIGAVKKELEEHDVKVPDDLFKDAVRGMDEAGGDTDSLAPMDRATAELLILTGSLDGSN